MRPIWTTIYGFISFGGSCEIGDFLFVSAFELTGQSIELRTQQFLSGALSSPFFRNLTPSSGETEYSETPPLIFGLWMDFLKLGSTGT
ncbi:hypothetical protein RhiirB3_454709 [Rhizophagus irregularis]|nr:hypothetical protein RhiirB3_454709 [Rhizophagus irregularis]